MKIQVTYPANEKEWYKENPTEWKTEEIQVTGQLMWIEPYKWGDKEGIALHFRVSTGTFWHFTTQRVLLH